MPCELGVASLRIRLRSHNILPEGHAILYMNPAASTWDTALLTTTVNVSQYASLSLSMSMGLFVCVYLQTGESDC